MITKLAVDPTAMPNFSLCDELLRYRVVYGSDKLRLCTSNCLPLFTPALSAVTLGYRSLCAVPNNYLSGAE
jgi:hypothetical protein